MMPSSFELRASSFELRASSFELRASSFELRASSFELRASSSQRDARNSLRPLGLEAVQTVHGLRPLAVEGVGQGGQALVDGGLDGGVLGLAGPAQHIVRHLARVPGVTDAEAQAMEAAFVAQRADDVAQAVVAA